MRKILTPALLAAAMSSGAAPVLAEESGEDKQQDSMLERAAETAPDPCIFDAATCLTERAFEFVGQMWV